MEKEKRAGQLITGPITDPGQLLLALVINQLAGEDGWAVNYRKDLAAMTRTKCRKASAKRIQSMVKMGYLEERQKPFPGLRLTEKAHNWEGVPDLSGGVSDLTEGALNPIKAMGQNTPSVGSETYQGGPETHPPNPSAYLPKKIKDSKEEEEEENSNKQNKR